ncbi:patatin-like phospholipase domain-containing protein 4 isoform X2 [Mercenaria mercenaria]|uniref:patatin-like phospholipase domain-containing protein 4 isoform X2 n=1 Tax=Mercenaria mercenaria TaxID=6596 RepID=UPI00234E876D|nr:patatin-like phospholipase domain-containing protein 4 isoform X2 [Mercenaria mercenaria]
MMNISFCGCGFLGIYHIGVAKALLKHAPSFLSKIERVGGASAGALIGALLVCEPNKLDVCRDFNLGLADDIRKKPLGALTPNFNLLDPVKEFMDKHMPEDGYKKANNVLFISLTKFEKGLPHNEVFSTYASNKALIEMYTDGGLMNNLVTFKEGKTVTVSPFCGNQDIAPTDDKGLGWFFRIKNQTFQFNKSNGTRGVHAVFPPHRDILLEYHETGYSNAVSFLKKEGYFEKYDV